MIHDFISGLAVGIYIGWFFTSFRWWYLKEKGKL